MDASGQQYILESGISNYADLNKQENEDEVLVALSGQVPKVYHGLSSAYPSPTGTVDLEGEIIDPSGYSFLIKTFNANEPLVSGEQVLNYDNLFSNFSQDDRTVPDEDLNYLNNYIHYYPRELVSTTLYSSEIQEFPVEIQPLNFIPLPVVRDSRYNYEEPEPETEVENE